MGLTVANVTSLRPHWEMVAAWASDIVILGETRLTKGGQRILGRLLRDYGWQVFWGDSMPTKGGGIWDAP